MKDIKRELMDDAREKGICRDGYREMLEADADGLVEYYVSCPDWCLERDYPTLAYLRQNFGAIENKGVFVDKTFHGEVLNDKQTYIFHNCRGTVKTGLNVNKAIIPMMYIANGCRIRFVGAGERKPRHASERPEVPVYVFGKNTLSAKDNAYVKFSTYNCGMI